MPTSDGVGGEPEIMNALIGIQDLERIHLRYGAIWVGSVA